MIAWLDALSGGGRLVAASLIVLLLALIVFAPVVFGAASLASAVQSYGAARDASGQIESRLEAFAARRADFRSAQGLTELDMAGYLDGPAAQAAFQASMTLLAERLREQGIAVRGEDWVQTRIDADGVTQLTADIAVAGELEAVLGVLNAPEFADLRTANAGFVAEGQPGQVRGALRFVRLHVGESEQAEAGDAR